MALNFEKLIEDYANLKITRKQFYSVLTRDAFGWELYKDKQRDILKAEKYRSNILRDRNLEVLYICGPSGSGKTTFAKYIAEQKHYDPFVSGSGEDILDGYDKEECIILDDFRAGTMKFSELLKFLDNNTGSSVKSRYFNKDINNCKLLIITSIQLPKELYGLFKNEDGTENKEPIEQFYRRIKHHYLYVSVDQDAIYNLSLNGKFERYPIKKLSQMYEELGIKPQETDDNSVIDELFEKIEL